MGGWTEPDGCDGGRVGPIQVEPHPGEPVASKGARRVREGTVGRRRLLACIGTTKWGEHPMLKTVGLSNLKEEKHRTFFRKRQWTRGIPDPIGRKLWQLLGLLHQQHEPRSSPTSKASGNALMNCWLDWDQAT